MINHIVIVVINHSRRPNIDGLQIGNVYEAIGIDIKPTGADTITLWFDKNCTYPKINVGVNDDTTASAVVKSVVQQFTYVATPDDQESRFFIWVDDENAFQQQMWSIASLDYDHTLLSIDQQTYLPNAGKFGGIGAEASHVYVDALPNRLDASRRD